MEHAESVTGHSIQDIRLDGAVESMDELIRSLMEFLGAGLEYSLDMLPK